MKNMGIGKQAKILTDKQQNLVLNHLKKSRYPLRNKVIFMLSFKAGLRAKEISGITWSMVCNSESEIGQEITLENKVSKGKYSGRVVPMHKDLRILLVELLKQRKQTEGFNLAENIVFSERGCKINPQAVVNFFCNLYKEIGFEGCSSHSGRRTFITNAAKNISFVGGTLNDVKMLAGHSNLQTTSRYIEYNAEAHKRVMELI